MNNNRQRFIGYGLLLTAMLALGSSFVTGKVVAEAFPQGLAIGIRLTLACLVIIPLALRYERGLRPFGHTAWMLVSVQALVGVVLYSFLLFRGFRLAPAAAAGVIYGTLPVVVALMSRILLSEQVTRATVLATLLALLGTTPLFMASGEGFPVAKNALLQDELILLASVFCASVFTVVGRHLAQRFAPVSIAARVSIVGWVAVLPLAAPEALAFDVSGLGAFEWLAVLWWAAATGIIYALLLYAALARVEASAVGVFTVLVPISIVAVSPSLLGEAVGLEHAFGILCAFAAVLLVTFGARIGKLPAPSLPIAAQPK